MKFKRVLQKIIKERDEKLVAQSSILAQIDSIKSSIEHQVELEEQIIRHPYSMPLAPLSEFSRNVVSGVK
jgi:hypothetical protein